MPVLPLLRFLVLLRWGIRQLTCKGRPVRVVVGLVRSGWCDCPVCGVCPSCGTPPGDGRILIGWTSTIRTGLSLAVAIAAAAAIIWVTLGPDDDAGGREAWQDPVVVDGDTLDATDPDGEVERIRILGIDTPEWDECGGAEATAALTELLAGIDEIYLVRDESQAERDAYDRVLAYVELGDGTDVGAELIADGHATEYTYDNAPHDRAARYAAAQRSQLVGC